VPTFDYSAYSKRLENLYNRLKQSGLRVQSTRLDAYRKAISAFDQITSADQVREWASVDNVKLLYNDLEDADEILEACDQFDNLSRPGLLDRLEKILSGPRVLAEETPNSGRPRNTLFELVLAARLKKAGFEVDLDSVEDVRFTLSGAPCFVECKRIHSPDKLSTRVKGAADQVTTRCDAAGTSSARGIIAIDVSEIESRDDFVLFCQHQRDIPLEIHRHLEAFILLHKEVFQSIRDRERRALAIYVYLRLLAAVPGLHGLVVAKTATVYLLHHSASKDGKLALQISDRLRASENP
jgi:hypothetical protein